MVEFSAADWRPPPLIANRAVRYGIGVIVAVYLALAFGTIDVDWARVVEGASRGGSFLAAFARPDFTSQWPDIRQGILESLTMTVASTIIGILLSIPIG